MKVVHGLNPLVEVLTLNQVKIKAMSCPISVNKERYQ